jgi:hypothetical protein
MASRKQSNKKILAILSQLVEENPDLRFSQILIISKILGENRFELGKTYYELDFYQESSALLEKITSQIKKAGTI